MNTASVLSSSRRPRQPGKDQREFLLVCAKRCDECLFSSAKLVDDRRKAEVLEECERTDKPFICHKHSIRADRVRGVARSEAKRTVCRGYWERFRVSRLVFRLADWLGVVRFVDVDGQIIGGESRGA